MPSEQNRDEDHEGRPDERDAAQPEEAGTDAGGEATGSVGTGVGLEGEPGVDVPRNRAERRAAQKRERRGIAPNRSVVVPGQQARPRLPPRTVTGKSNVEEVPPWARDLVAAMGRHRRALIAGAFVVILVAGATVGWVLYREQKLAQAAALYQEAVDIALAPIRPADAPPEPPSVPRRRGPTFPDHGARSRAALEAFRRVIQRFPDAPVAPLARLSEATALYDLGRYAEARRVFESLVGADLAGQEGRALEGLGFSLEAMNDLPGALRRYEELGRLHNGAWRDLAAFHQARVLHRMNQDQRAKDILRSLLERLGRSRPDDFLGVGGNATVYEQAQALLREIDPDDPLGRRQILPNDPEALLRLLERQTGQRLRIPRPTETGGAPGGTDGGR